VSSYIALFDANVLYPAPIRDLLLQLALSDLFRAHWTNDIHNEWIENLLMNNTSLSREKLERTRDLMNSKVRDCLIEGYHELIPGLNLPDKKDRHVLAAAIVGNCDVIVTQNLKDFPTSETSKYGIEAQHPDEFISNLTGLAPGIVCEAVKKVRARLKNPPYSVEEYLDTLRKQGLLATAGELEQFKELL
jgi:predicted nucleic acid-binding protein